MKMPQESEIKVEANVDLGILIGLLLTDGCVSKSKKGSVQIKFTAKSDVLHEIFREKMKKLFGVEKFLERFNVRVHENSVSIVKDTIFVSNRIMNFLHTIVPTFRKKPFKDGTFPSTRLPDFVFNLEPSEIAKILQVMFSADGSVCLWVQWRKDQRRWTINRCVELACKHPTIAEQVTELLIKLGFHPLNRRKSGKVSLLKQEDIIKFKEKIGFIPGVKVTAQSKVWEGFEKNQVLDLAVRTIGLKKKDLEKFKTKEEVINFLKSKIV